MSGKRLQKLKGLRGFLVILVILIILVILAIPQSAITLRSPDGEIVDIAVEVVTTPRARAKGLMYRTELPERQGMLFIFDSDALRSFWMKDTLMPLDIMYFTAAGDFVSSASMTPCEEDPCMGHPSDAPARYALEVPLGFVEEFGVGEGWTLEL